MISNLFVRVQPTQVASTDQVVTEPKKEFQLWGAYFKENYPPYVIYDSDGYVTKHVRAAALRPLSMDEIQDLVFKLPSYIQEKLLTIAQDWGFKVTKQTTLESLDNQHITPFILTPVPRLRDPEYLREKDWKKFVDSVIAFGIKKDPKIHLAQKPHLLRGLNMRINPHAIIVTNPGTTKSTFYQMTGKLEDKVTPGSFVGYAKSPKEIFFGTMNGSELSIGLDQIESQGASELFRYLFNLLENGICTVGSGAVDFDVTSSSSVAFLANPPTQTNDASRSFATLIEHLSNNSAFARRLGIIVFGTEFQTCTGSPDNETLDKWAKAVYEFRAVEEYVWKDLQRIVQDKNVWTSINSEIPNYERSVLGLTDNLADYNLKQTLRAHGSGGQRRVRSAALYASLVDNLAEIALYHIGKTEGWVNDNPYPIDKILEDAEEYLNRFVELNLESIGRVCNEWVQTQLTIQKSYFDNLPDYLKEIVSAIELRKRLWPEDMRFSLEQIPYSPANNAYGGYFSECVRELNRKKEPTAYLGKIKQYWDFDLHKEGDSWIVTLLTKKVNASIVPKGKLELSGFGGFGDSGRNGRDTNTPEDKTSVSEDSPRKPENPETAETIFICAKCQATFTKAQSFKDHVDGHERGIF